jgi:hypothetical protein
MQLIFVLELESMIVPIVVTGWMLQFVMFLEEIATVILYVLNIMTVVMTLKIQQSVS